MQELKTKVLEQVQDQLRGILDKALTETIPPFGKIHQTVNGTTTKKPSSRYRGDNFHLHTHYTHITPFCSPQNNSLISCSKTFGSVLLGLREWMTARFLWPGSPCWSKHDIITLRHNLKPNIFNADWIKFRIIYDLLYIISQIGGCRCLIRRTDNKISNRQIEQSVTQSVPAVAMGSSAEWKKRCYKVSIRLCLQHLFPPALCYGMWL